MKRALKRGPLSLLAACAVALALAGYLAPGAVAAGTVSGDVEVSNTETVQVHTDATGKVASQRVYEQLVLVGDGEVDLANPVSTDGLRNLDGFGGYDVRDGQVRIKTDVDGTKKFRSVSDFDGTLPVDLKIEYRLDGKSIDPADIVGRSGTLEVNYTVTNTTGVEQDVAYEDGEGTAKSSTEKVVVPMVGSLSTVLPSTFTEVTSEQANIAGDGRGGTKLSFTMTLIPPIGGTSAKFGYTAEIRDGAIPEATLSALPVNPLASPSFKGGAASYQGGAQTGQDLTAGATEIDGHLLEIRDGAQDLVAGILQLSDGAHQLSAGLSGEAAPGAKKLASGAGEIADGAGLVADGNGALADGLAEASSKAPALVGGLEQIAAGLAALDAGLATFNGQVVGGLTQINGGATQLATGLSAQLIPGLTQVEGALDNAGALAGSLDDAVPQKANLVALIGGAKSGVSTVKGGLSGQVLPGVQQIAGGSQQLITGVNAQTSAGAAATDGTLKNGVAKLKAGIAQIIGQSGPLVEGLGQLSAGADELAAGAGALADGTTELDAGATKLSAGLTEAAAGSGKLADGLAQAAEKAPALPEGAKRLSEEGMSQLLAAGNETASDYGLKYALIEAGAERAADAQPYGSPEGAIGLAAYTMEIAGEDGSASANVARGLAAVGVLGAALALTLLRRRVRA